MVSIILGPRGFLSVNFGYDVYAITIQEWEEDGLTTNVLLLPKSRLSELRQLVKNVVEEKKGDFQRFKNNNHVLSVQFDSQTESLFLDLRDNISNTNCTINAPLDFLDSIG